MDDGINFITISIFSHDLSIPFVVDVLKNNSTKHHAKIDNYSDIRMAHLLDNPPRKLPKKLNAKSKFP